MGNLLSNPGRRGQTESQTVEDPQECLNDSQSLQNGALSCYKNNETPKASHSGWPFLYLEVSMIPNLVQLLARFSLWIINALLEWALMLVPLAS